MCLLQYVSLLIYNLEVKSMSTSAITPISRTDTVNYTEADIYKELEYLKELFTKLRICDTSNISFMVKIVNRRKSNCHGSCQKVNRTENSYLIRISSSWLKYASPQAVHDTICHEFIHALPGCMNHGLKWKTYCNKFMAFYPNYTLSRTTSDEGHNEYQLQTSKYHFVCPNCGVIGYFNRMTRDRQFMFETQRYKCRKCGAKVGYKQMY